jgi:hypothetical protein
MPVAEGIEKTLGIRRQTGRPYPRVALFNRVNTLGPCPTLARVFRDEDIPAPGRVTDIAERVPLRGEVPKRFPLALSRFTDQSGGKDPSRGSGWGLPQVRSLGKRFFAQANGADS